MAAVFRGVFYSGACSQGRARQHRPRDEGLSFSSTAEEPRSVQDTWATGTRLWPRKENTFWLCCGRGCP